MKYRFSAWPLKLLVILLALFSLGFGFLSGALTIWCEIQGYYSYDDYFETQSCQRTLVDYAEDMQSYLYNVSAPFADYAALHRLYEDANFRYILLDPNNKILDQYTEGLDLVPNKALTDAIQEAQTEPYWPTPVRRGKTGTPLEGLAFIFYSVGIPSIDDDGDSTVMSRRILCLVDPDNLEHQDDFTLGLADFERFYPIRFDILVVLGVSILVFCLSVVLLLCQAGRKPGQTEAALGGVHKWPLELLLLPAAVLVIFDALSIAELFDRLWYPYQDFALSNEALLWCSLALTVVTGALTLLFLCSFAARCKAGKWWRNSIVWKLGEWVWGLAVRFLRWVWHYVKKPLSWLSSVLKQIFGVFPQAAKALPIAPRLISCLLGLLAVDFLLGCFALGMESGFLLCLFVFYTLALLAAAIYACGQLKRLWNTAEHLAKGELDYQLDTSKMYWDFKTHGDNLNAIAQGMNKAVEQRMQSERLKTQLITNVSHDIKTPLTSIVNYVDLLQKPHTKEEEAQYLEVLDRQSKRLKRLTENLVEASKASTGNVPVNLAPTNVTEILNQAAEEYRQRLEKERLELVLATGHDLSVLADGKLLWRILDNLLGNAVKYALPGTRVYLGAAAEGETVLLSVKNISREPLNVEASELLERFVRGDASRHTEGSGLGLNIAQSLTQLQNGRFRLTVDGDLFKAEIELPKAQAFGK